MYLHTFTQFQINNRMLQTPRQFIMHTGHPITKTFVPNSRISEEFVWSQQKRRLLSLLLIFYMTFFVCSKYYITLSLSPTLPLPHFCLTQILSNPTHHPHNTYDHANVLGPREMLPNERIHSRGAQKGCTSTTVQTDKEREEGYEGWRVKGVCNIRESAWSKGLIFNEVL